jgi:hypothetical protein
MAPPRHEQPFMQPIYHQIRQRARQIILRHPTPDFYRDHALADETSRRLFDSNPIIKKLLSFVAKILEDDFGHGLIHAVKVSRDAGSVICIETRHRSHDPDRLSRLICLSSEEITHICRAIQNHEAFKDRIDAQSPEGELISDSLYDADKFRWGPDNFHDTLWDMVSYFNPPLAEFIEGYPQGMKKLETIKKTFRTATGKKYGPQFIDLGLAIGEELYAVIKTEFSGYL